MVTITIPEWMMHFFLAATAVYAIANAVEAYYSRRLKLIMQHRAEVEERFRHFLWCKMMESEEQDNADD